MRSLLSALLVTALTAVVVAAQQEGAAGKAPPGADAAARMDLHDARAMDEMLRGTAGKGRRWMRQPHLVVVTGVLQFQDQDHRQFTATGTQLTESEAGTMVADLTAGLALLSGGTFGGFASVRIEPARAGASVSVVRPGEIVAGRFRGVRAALDAVGFGGRTTRADGTITSGVVMLDEEYDRDDSQRRLLRMHELGHALGFNHVTSQRSVMNAVLGAEPTEFDRRVARIAFRHLAPAAAVQVLAQGSR